MAVEENVLIGEAPGLLELIGGRPREWKEWREQGQKAALARFAPQSIMVF